MKSRLRDATEAMEFDPEVAKQHDVFALAITFGVFASSRASLDKVSRKLLECFNKENLAFVPPTDYATLPPMKTSIQLSARLSRCVSSCSPNSLHV